LRILRPNNSISWSLPVPHSTLSVCSNNQRTNHRLGCSKREEKLEDLGFRPLLVPCLMAPCCRPPRRRWCGGTLRRFLFLATIEFLVGSCSSGSPPASATRPGAGAQGHACGINFARAAHRRLMLTSTRASARKVMHAASISLVLLTAVSC
jgi:hypothetical protein